METIKKNSGLIIFTVLTLLFAVWYAQHTVVSGGFVYARNRTPLGRLGKGLGFLGFFSMGLVYARSVLKILVREDAFWKRLEPLVPEEIFDLKKFSTKILLLLNKSHAYFGALSAVLIFLHCYLTGSYLDNFLLQAVLLLIAVETISGFFMKLKYSPVQLRQKSYFIHRQFVIGAIIVIFALFGHLILKRWGF